MASADPSIDGTGRARGVTSGVAFQRQTSRDAQGTMDCLLFRTSDKPGALEEVLRIFWKYDINLSRIESRPAKSDSYTYDFFVDFTAPVGEQAKDSLMAELNKVCASATLLAPKEVPWFPRMFSELDQCVSQTLDAGAELQADHPGFSDADYRARRQDIADYAFQYKSGTRIEHWEYNDQEKATWGVVYNKLKHLFGQYGCRQYNEILPILEKECGYRDDNLPQVGVISDFLRDRTGFRLRPVAGLLSARDFLNGLAFKTFFSTQYIRHHSKPLYTPEPDVCHELIGHAPMFADPDFAEFSHEIGLASLGASDHDIVRLATCYWFSVEFGLCREGDHVKAYGAGLLSSFGELEYSCAPHRPAGGSDEFPEYLPWEPEKAAITEYPITTYQPKYFVAESLTDAKDKVKDGRGVGGGRAGAAHQQEKEPLLPCHV